MMIAEEFGGMPGWTISILGTDLSSAILERARAGRYSQLEINRGLPAKYLAQYFTREGTTGFSPRDPAQGGVPRAEPVRALEQPAEI